MSGTFTQVFKVLASIWRAFAAGVTGLFLLGLPFCAHGGWCDPAVVPVAAMACMALPTVFAASVLWAVVLLIAWRKPLPLMAVAWLVSAFGLWFICPINLSEPQSRNPEKEFTLLTYNVLHFWDTRDGVDTLTRNPTLDFILSVDADILCLQECETKDLKPRGKNGKQWHILASQIDSLHSRYPYRWFDGHMQALFSKYPFVQIPPEHVVDSMPNYQGALVEVKGRKVSVFNVHLKSIGFSDDEKIFYRDIYADPPTNPSGLRQELREVKHSILSKLVAAFKARARESRILKENLTGIKGSLIVAGDFNDVPGSYAVHQLMDIGLDDAYFDVGRGPTITYHANLFYFRIDQVLYKGLRPLKIERPDFAASDHYPLLTTFRFK